MNITDIAPTTQLPRTTGPIRRWIANLLVCIAHRLAPDAFGVL